MTAPDAPAVELPEAMENVLRNLVGPLRYNDAEAGADGPTARLLATARTITGSCLSAAREAGRREALAEVDAAATAIARSAGGMLLALDDGVWHLATWSATLIPIAEFGAIDVDDSAPLLTSLIMAAAAAAGEATDAD